MITPYFGKLPEWMGKFEPPKGYDWLLDTDLENFKARVKEKLGIEYPGEYGNPKVWDYRCALGLLYEDEIKDFDFWGHCDFDVVFGDVDHFLPDSWLSQLDIYSGHDEYVCGCFSLYKNRDEVNRLFTNAPNWQKYMIYPDPNGWVEKEFSQLIEHHRAYNGDLNIRYEFTFRQGNPWVKGKPILKKENLRLFQTELSMNGVWHEIMFFHFRHSKQWPL